MICLSQINKSDDILIASYGHGEALSIFGEFLQKTSGELRDKSAKCEFESAGRFSTHFEELWSMISDKIRAKI